uniref:Ciliary neurotrophic factor n=1 Tax=Astyanax mexicanus TaxID=7994 RepID=A0A3B1IUU0_ASTMX
IHFEDRRLVLNTLPSITIKYRTWLQMEDTERLSSASRDLNTFWSHLESQRQKLEMEMEEGREGAADRTMQRRNKRGRPQLSLPQSMLGVQLDLRDLMRQVNSQVSQCRRFLVPPTRPPQSLLQPPAPLPALSGPSRWVSRLEGYVILRDLERYLTKLARDYTLLLKNIWPAAKSLL